MLTYANMHIVAGACAEIPVPRSATDGTGVVTDAALRRAIGEIVHALVARRA